MKNESQFILAVLDDDFHVNHEISEMDQKLDLKKILKIASNNRILNCFAFKAKQNGFYRDNYEYLDLICNEGDLWIKKFKNTLDLLNNKLGQENIAIIKTFKFFQDITFDVDIILQKESNCESLLNDENFEVTKISGGIELNPITNEYLSIDIYNEFLFRKKKLMSDDFIFNNLRNFDYNQENYLIPSIESELLLYLSQINFQMRFLTIYDFLQVTKTILNAKSINWSLLFNETHQFGWNDSFVETLSLINGLYLELYGKDLNIPIPAKTNLKVRFPYFISPLNLFKYDNEFLKRDLIKYIHTDLWYLYSEVSAVHIKKRIPIYRPWIDLNAVFRR